MFSGILKKYLFLCVAFLLLADHFNLYFLIFKEMLLLCRKSSNLNGLKDFLLIVFQTRLLYYTTFFQFCLPCLACNLSTKLYIWCFFIFFSSFWLIFCNIWVGQDRPLRCFALDMVPIGSMWASPPTLLQFLFD